MKNIEYNKLNKDTKIIRVYQPYNWLTITEDAEGKIFYLTDIGYFREKWRESTKIVLIDNWKMYHIMGRKIQIALYKFILN